MNELHLKQVSYAFQPDGKTLFGPLKVLFQAHRPTVIRGETGSGKTTLLKILTLLTRPTRGEVYFNQDAVSRWTNYHRDCFRRTLGFVPQHPLWIDGISVFENILLPLIPLNWKPQDMNTRVVEVLGQMDLLHVQNQQVHSLSGGEAQRLNHARALVHKPRLLFLDEPSSSQDDTHLSQLFDAWSTLDQEGCLILAVTHDPRLTNHDFFKQNLLLEKGALHTS